MAVNREGRIEKKNTLWGVYLGFRAKGLRFRGEFFYLFWVGIKDYEDPCLNSLSTTTLSWSVHGAPFSYNLKVTM